MHRPLSTRSGTPRQREISSSSAMTCHQTWLAVRTRKMRRVYRSCQTDLSKLGYGRHRPSVWPFQVTCAHFKPLGSQYYQKSWYAFFNRRALALSSFKKRSITSSSISIYCPPRNRYLFQRRDSKGLSWMVWIILIAKTPKRLCSETTSNLISEDKWNTPSMMSLSFLGRSKMSNRKRSRKLIGTCAQHTL